jgi:hypothetical protein
MNGQQVWIDVVSRSARPTVRQWAQLDNTCRQWDIEA